ncbi:ribonuclease H-like domain-containing protein, partial [Tanacetum coccineum]
LCLSQKKYALQLFEHAHMVTCNPYWTPVDTESKLGPEGAPVQDPTLYRILAGGLQYLTFTRPYLSYAVQQICLYMHDPREPHLAALKRILRYVQGTLDLGLPLYASSTTSLVGYTDADWAGCPSTRSTEAKYRGVANVVAETAWLRNLLRELHSPLSIATLVYCDNVRVLHVPSRFQYADIFTKGLPSALFEEFRSSLSLGWRNILKLRNEVRQHLFKKVGNGETTSIWFDQWTGIGALCDSVSYRDLYDARFKATMTVRAFVDVYNRDNIDVLMWKSNDGTLSKFSVRQAYYDLHNTSEVVPWSKLVWFSQNIPKHAFILWLAIKGKLTTQDKVKRWGSFNMMACPLCYEDMDSHEHLFFECKFSNCLWNMVKMKIKFQSVDIKWKDLISKLSNLQNGNSIGSIVGRLCLAACVYLIWQERNNRIFRNEERSIDSLFTTLCNTIKSKSQKIPGCYQYCSGLGH